MSEIILGKIDKSEHDAMWNTKKHPIALIYGIPLYEKYKLLENTISQIISNMRFRKAYFYSSDMTLHGHLIHNINFSRENIRYFNERKIIDEIWDIFQVRKDTKYARELKEVFVFIDNVEDVIEGEDKSKLIELLKYGKSVSINFAFTTKLNLTEKTNTIINEIKKYSSLNIFQRKDDKELYLVLDDSAGEQIFSIKEEIRPRYDMSGIDYRVTDPLIGFDYKTNKIIRMDDDYPNGVLFGKSRDYFIPGKKFDLIASIIDQLSREDNQIYYCNGGFSETKIKEKISYPNENIQYYSSVEKAIDELLKIQTDRLELKNLVSPILKESGIYLSIVPYHHNVYLIIEKLDKTNLNTLKRLKEIIELGNTVNIYVIGTIDEKEEVAWRFLKDQDLNFDMHIIFSREKPTVQTRKLKNNQILQENTVVVEYYEKYSR